MACCSPVIGFRAAGGFGRELLVVALLGCPVATTAPRHQPREQLVDAILTASAGIPLPSAVSARLDPEKSILAACGVPVFNQTELFGLGAGAAKAGVLFWRDPPGLGRRFPGRARLASEVGSEARRHHRGRGARERPTVVLELDEGATGDTRGSARARAFQSLVGGGMAPDRAAGLAGLMESDGWAARGGETSWERFE